LLALAVALLPGVLLMAFGFAIARPSVLQGLLERGLGPGSGGRVTMHDAGFVPPATVNIDELQIFLPPILDTPLFKTPLCMLRPRFADLLRGRLGFNRLELAEFEVRVIRRPDGGINLPGLAKLAALFEERERARVLTALSDPGELPSIHSFRLQGGRFMFQDQATQGELPIESLTAQGQLVDGILRLTPLEGRIFDCAPISLEGRVRLKQPSSVELKLKLANLPAIHLAPWLLPPQDRKRKNALSGDLSGDATFAILDGSAKANGQLQSPVLELDDRAVTRARWQAHGLNGDFVATRDAKGQTNLVWQFRGDNLRVARGAPDSALQFDGLRGELESQGGSHTLRLTECKFGSGTLSAGGVFDGPTWSLALQAQQLDLGALLVAFGQSELAGTLDAAVLDSVEARLSSDGIDVSKCRLHTARELTFEGTCNFRLSPGGLDLAGVSGLIQAPAATLAELTGVAPPETVEGTLSAELTAETTKFTALLRTLELSLGEQPRFKIKGLAAAVSGVVTQADGRRASGWSASVRANRFTVVWNGLAGSLGLPPDWPLAMTGGSATVVKDLQGLHVREFLCQGAQGGGTGEVHLSPEGQLSGRLRTNLSLKGSPGTTFATRILSGTLDQPEFTVE
jgi:hypothetical protein